MSSKPPQGEPDRQQPVGRLQRLKGDPIQTALNHPLRRAIIRILNGDQVSASASSLAEQLSCSTDLLLYHCKILRKYALAQTTPGPMIKGRPEAYFSSCCREDEQVRKHLARWQSADDAETHLRGGEQAA